MQQCGAELKAAGEPPSVPWFGFDDSQVDATYSLPEVFPAGPDLSVSAQNLLRLPVCL